MNFQNSLSKAVSDQLNFFFKITKKEMHNLCFSLECSACYVIYDFQIFQTLQFVGKGEKR